MPKKVAKYDQVIKYVFDKNHSSGTGAVDFTRNDLVEAHERLGLNLTKNLGDIPYTYRFRKELPEVIRNEAPEGHEWVIEGRGDAAYQFRLAKPGKIAPRPEMALIKVPDATPEIIRHYAPGSDEQALLTRARYNRLVGLFTGLTCYSIQNHLRTKVEGIGQIEVDEVYVGVNKHGAHFVIPCQAKSPGDRFGIAQVRQDTAFCQQKYPHARCRPLGLQFLGDNRVAILEFTTDEEDDILCFRIVEERHYQLIPADQLTPEELHGYAAR